MLSIPLFFSCFLYSYAYTNGLLSKIFELKVFQFIGKISYSIYLNHFIIVLVIPRFIFKYLMLENSQINQVLVFLISLILILLYSTFTHVFIAKDNIQKNPKKS